MPPPPIPNSPSLSVAYPDGVAVYVPNTPDYQHMLQPQPPNTYSLHPSLTSGGGGSIAEQARRQIKQSPLNGAQRHKKSHQQRRSGMIPKQSHGSRSSSILVQGLNLNELPPQFNLPPMVTQTMALSLLNQSQTNMTYHPSQHPIERGSQSARGSASVAPPTVRGPLLPSLPVSSSARGEPSYSSHHPPPNRSRRNTTSSRPQTLQTTSEESSYFVPPMPSPASHAKLFPSQSAHAFPLPASLQSILRPSLSSQALEPPIDHRTGAGYNPHAAHPLHAYAPETHPHPHPHPSSSSTDHSPIRTRHRIGYKERVKQQYSLSNLSSHRYQFHYEQLSSRRHLNEEEKSEVSPKNHQGSRKSISLSRIQSEEQLLSSEQEQYAFSPTSPSHHSTSFMEADRAVILQYLHSSACGLWSNLDHPTESKTSHDQSISPPTLTAADIHQLLRTCHGSSTLALQSIKNFDLQNRKFTSTRALLKALQQLMQQRNLLYQRITGKVPPVSHSSSQANLKPLSVHSTYNFFLNPALTLLLDFSAIDRFGEECPFTPLTLILRLLDEFEVSKIKFQHFNELISLVRGAETDRMKKVEIQFQPNSPMSPKNRKAAIERVIASPIMSPKGKQQQQPGGSPQPSPRLTTTNSSGTAEETAGQALDFGTEASDSTSSVQPTTDSLPTPVAPINEADFHWTNSSHIDIKSLQEFMCYPTRTLFQKENSTLVSPFKSELSSLLAQVGPNASGVKFTSGSWQPESLSPIEQEKLLRIHLFHLEWKGFHCPNAAALNKEVAKANQTMFEALKPLYETDTWNEIEVGLGLGDSRLTKSEKDKLYLYSTCGPYLYFHLKCLIELKHKVTSYQELLEALQSQHLQFISQRIHEILLLKSYLLSLHCYLFFEQPMNITRYECAQIIEFNTGIKRVSSKAPPKDLVSPATAVSPRNDVIQPAETAASTAEPGTSTTDPAPTTAAAVDPSPSGILSYPSLLGSENSISVFQYFQLLQTLGCKFESVPELIAGMRSLYVEQDILWSRRGLVRKLLPQLGITNATDADIFNLVYEPLHGGLQSIIHLQLLIASKTHFASMQEIHTMLTWSFLHSLEPASSTPIGDASGLDESGLKKFQHLSYGNSANLFIYSFLISPVACHMLEMEVKSNLTLQQVHQLRMDVIQTSVDSTSGSVAPTMPPVSPVNPLQFLRILYDLEEESAVAGPAHLENDDEFDEEAVLAHQRTFQTFAEFSTALRESSKLFVSEKAALYQWLNDPALNTMFPPSFRDDRLIVSPDELDHFLDLHAASIPPSSILNLARALNGQGKKVNNLVDFTHTILKLQSVQSSSKALLFTYLASNTHRLLAKSCLIHDSDLAALIATATSGAAALLILQRMEKDLLLQHYTLQAQMSNNRLSQAQRDELQEQDTMLGGMSMAELIHHVHLFVEDTDERIKEVKHFIQQAHLIEDATFDVNKADINQLLECVRGLDILADVQVHLLWIFSRGHRFASWDDLVIAMKHGVRNGPSNMMAGVDTSQTFFLPTDEEMMLVIHLFGPICSVLKSGNFFSLVQPTKGVLATLTDTLSFGDKSSSSELVDEFHSLIKAAGDSCNFALQHFIGLQVESVTCTTIAELITKVGERQADMVQKKHQLWNFLNQKDCKLFLTSTTSDSSSSTSDEIDRFQVTPTNVNRLFSLTQTEGDLYKLLTEAVSIKSVSSLSSISPIVRHGPYRFFSHFIMSIRGYFPHQYMIRARKPGIIEIGRATSGINADDGSLSIIPDVNGEETWKDYLPIYRLATGTSALVHDPATNTPLTLDTYEIQNLLSATNSNPHACSMHLSLLEVMHRKFGSVHALLHAVTSAQKESLKRIPELRSYLGELHGLFKDDTKSQGYWATRAELEQLYYQSGTGPLCGLFIQEFMESNPGKKVTGMKELIGIIKSLHERFIARRAAELVLLRAFFHGSYDMKMLLGKKEEATITLDASATTTERSTSPTVDSPGVHITDTELSQLLLAGETGVAVLIHLQHATLPGHDPVTSIQQLQASFANAPTARVKQSMLEVIRDPKSDLLSKKFKPKPSQWTEIEIDQLLRLSNSHTDALLQLWALNASTCGFESMDLLANAIHSGRIGCLEPVPAQLAMILAYLHSPTVNLLSVQEKRDISVADVQKLIELCGGSISHSFTMLISLDEQNLQFHNIKDLAQEIAVLNGTAKTSEPLYIRPTSALTRAYSRPTPRTLSLIQPSPKSTTTAVEPVASVIPPARPRRATKELHLSPIFTFIKNSNGIFDNVTSFEPSNVRSLLTICQDDEPCVLLLLQQFSRSQPMFEDLRSFLAGFQRVYNSTTALLSFIQSHRLFNKPINITLSDIDSLLLQTNLGPTALLEFCQRLDEVGQFGSWQELVQAIKTMQEQYSQLNEAQKRHQQQKELNSVRGRSSLASKRKAAAAEFLLAEQKTQQDQTPKNKIQKELSSTTPIHPPHTDSSMQLYGEGSDVYDQPTQPPPTFQPSRPHAPPSSSGNHRRVVSVQIDSTPLESKRTAVLQYLHEPQTRLFQNAGVLQEITTRDLDRLLKMSGKAQSPEECIKILKFLQETNNKFKTPADLCFAVLKAQRALFIKTGSQTPDRADSRTSHIRASSSSVHAYSTGHTPAKPLALPVNNSIRSRQQGRSISQQPPQPATGRTHAHRPSSTSDVAASMPNSPFPAFSSGSDDESTVLTTRPSTQLDSSATPTAY